VRPGAGARLAGGQDGVGQGQIGTGGCEGGGRRTAGGVVVEVGRGALAWGEGHVSRRGALNEAVCSITAGCGGRGVVCGLGRPHPGRGEGVTVVSGVYVWCVQCASNDNVCAPLSARAARCKTEDGGRSGPRLALADDGRPKASLGRFARGGTTIAGRGRGRGEGEGDDEDGDGDGDGDGDEEHVDADRPSDVSAPTEGFCSSEPSWEPSEEGPR
jgi:hypothetical protein